MNDVPNIRSESPGEHLDEMTCLLYVEGQLDRQRGQEVSAHAQDCLPCRTLLRALERESRLLTRSMLEVDEPFPSRLAALQERAAKSMQWIWGAIFGLAATGIYAVYTGYVEPMQQRFEEAGFGSSNLLNLLIFQGAFWKGWQSMITLVEIVAMLMVAGVGAMLMRRRMRRGPAFAMIPMLMALLFAGGIVSTPAMGAEFRKGDTVEIEKNENIVGDVFLTGHHAKVEGTVDGDVYLFCQNADIEGHVNGDVIAFAQIVHITGQVDGNVRSFSNTIVISGSVEKSITSFAENITLDASGKIGHSMTTFVESLSVDGHLGRDILLFANAANISGAVGGSIQGRGDSLHFGSGSQVDGHVKFTGNKSPDVSNGAKLAFPVEFTRIEHHSEYSQSKFYVWRVIWTGATILFGLVLFLVLPTFTRDTVTAAENYGASLGLGILVLFGIPIAAVIACITIVGIPVGFSAFMIWLMVLYSAQIVVGSIVGQWLMGRTRETWQLIGRMIVGLILIRVVEMTPFLGALLRSVVVLWGMGAISLSIYRRFQPQMGAVVPPAAPYVPPTLPPNTTITTPQPA